MMSHGDVRMRGFVERIHIDEALARLLPLVMPTDSERVHFERALGRTVASTVTSPIAVPAFQKSAVDGYGIHAEESFGASSANPLSFTLAFEVLPGAPPGRAIAKGEAVRIMTGGPVPPGVDAVVMAEHAEERTSRVRLTEPVPPGKNVVRIGEDIEQGDVVLRSGRRLRPADLGVLASIGQVELDVRRRPRVAIATTGNELVPPEDLAKAGPSAVVNSNSYVLEALVSELGGEPERLAIIPDDVGCIRDLVRGFPGDILLTTGGTSVGQEDFLPVVVDELGELAVHGLNIRPGSPSGFGIVDGRLVFLLPGNPVAAMVGFDVLVRPCLQRLLGQEDLSGRPRVEGRLRRKVASALNRVDFVRVKLTGGEVEPVLSGGAGVLTSMTRADGYLIVGKDREGHDEGEIVSVELF